MIPLSNIADAINNAKLYLIQETKDLREKLELSSKDCDVKRLVYINLLIKTLSYDLANNFSDNCTEELYKRLVGELDGFNGPYEVDNSVVLPSGTIVFYVGADSYWGRIYGNINDQVDLIQLLDAKANLPNEVASGGVIDISDFSNGNITVGPTEWYIMVSGNRQLYAKYTPTLFSGIALSSAGKQRFIVFIANTNNQILLIEGDESAAAQLPTPLPPNTVTIGYCLVTDSSIGSPVNPDIELGKGLIKDDEGKITLDLESKQLVGVSISVNWSLFQELNDVGGNPIPYDPPSSTLKNLIVDKGVRANLSATYQYPNPNSVQSLPLITFGDFGNVLPPPNTASNPLNVNGVTSNDSWIQTIAKPKSGLVVVGSQVQFPTGNDTTEDSISITFLGRGVLAYFTESILSASQIQSVLNGAQFQSDKARTFSAVTASGGKYTYYLYDAALGNVTNVIQNGALPVFTAFQFLAQVAIVNAAGHSMNVIVCRSNATDAFTNATLAFL